MKKSKIITGLSAAFVATIALMSCSQIIRPKNGVVLTIDGVEYTAQDLWNDNNTPAAAQAMFDGVYKVAIRNYFTHQDGKDLKQEIDRELEVKISGEKSKASSDASKNGTSYDVEWQKILDANNCENETELRNKFEYDIQKEKFNEKFYSQKFKDTTNCNYDVLRDGGKLKDPQGIEHGENSLDGYIKAKHPYHIKHILVKLESAGENNNTTATISADEARRLHDVICALAKGDSFKSVSDNYSQDDTAKKDGGSLGVMDLDTSFVDDFKLGIYLYESFIGSSTQTAGGDYEAKSAKEELGLVDSTTLGKINPAGDFAQKISELVDPTAPTTPSQVKGIGQIPFEAALALGDTDYTITGQANTKGLANLGYDDFKALKANGVEELNDKYLPRNVIFNKYFNKHNIMVITPTALSDYSTGTYAFASCISNDGTKRSIEDSPIGGDLTITSGDTYYAGFNRAANKNEDSITNINKPLRDENGRVILVFRSGTSGDSGYQGIHFVVIERSPFIGKEFDDNNKSGKQDTTIEEYFTHYYPGQADGYHPVYPSDAGAKAGKPKKTFVHTIDTDTITYKNRADTMKNNLKNCVNDLNTYIYEYLLAKGGFQFTDNTGKEIEAKINNWIKVNRDDNKYQQEVKWNDDWERYYNSLKTKLDERKEVNVGTSDYWSELIPESCVYALTKALDVSSTLNFKGMFSVGGVFHD